MSAAAAAPASPFNPRLVAGLIVAGVLGFLALVLLVGYGDSLDDGRSVGGAHAGSRSAVGYQALVELTGEFHDTALIEYEEDLTTEDLVVVALDERTDSDEIAGLLRTRQGKATLFILPKWHTMRHPRRRGWVVPVAAGQGARFVRMLGEDLQVDTGGTRRRGSPTAIAQGDLYLEGIAFPVPDDVQTVSGKTIEPLVRLPNGRTLVARLGGQPHYLVADPDLLNNHGLSDAATARAALQLIAALNSTEAQAVYFDITLNDGERYEGPSLIRTMFEPPFLVMTLALAAAALLAGLHGLFRFGPLNREGRAIAFGKAALVENSAALIRLARREARLGAAYAELVRQEVARTTGASHSVPSDGMDAYLDRLTPPGRPTFSALAERLRAARDRQQLVAAARALFQWKKDIIR